MIAKKSRIFDSDQAELTTSQLTTELTFVGDQFGGRHGALDTESSMIAAAATQSEPFPCFRKSAWVNLATAKFGQTRIVLDMA